MKIKRDAEDKDFLVIEVGKMVFPILTNECRLLIFTGVLLGLIIVLIMLIGIIGKPK